MRDGLDADRAIGRSDDPWAFTPAGLVVNRELTEVEFEQIGRRIGSVYNATRWAIGDWLIYGEGMGFAGAKYERAADITRMSYESLSQSYRVASEFDTADRVARLSWTHHRAVLTLPRYERAAVLERAVRETWTSEQVRLFCAEFIALPAGRTSDDAPAPPAAEKHQRKVDGWRDVPQRTRMRRECPKCGHRWEIRTTASDELRGGPAV